MKNFVLGVLVLATSVLAFGSSTEPWLLSPGERLSERFNPQAIQARDAAGRATVRHVKQGLTPIFGDTHPHLFFPWELFDFFLRQTDREPSRRQLIREHYRTAIVEAGWDFDQFWQAVELAAINFVATKQYFGGEQERTRGRMDAADEARLTHDLCQERAAALQSLRAQFGEVAFNKFLYTAVAPQIRMWSNTKRDAAVLVRVEGGCR